MNDFGIYEHAITLDEHRALTAGRTRNLSDPYMSTKGADRTRAQQAATYVSPLPDNPKPVRLPRQRDYATPVECGTDRGYNAHRRHGERACTACLTAHNRAVDLRRTQRTP